MSVIVSLNPLGHDASAALVRDGRLVAAALEERFTRVKHHQALPAHALAACLRTAGLTLDEVDHFVVPFSDRLYARYGRSRVARSLARIPLRPAPALKNLYVQLPSAFRSTHRHLYRTWFERTFAQAAARRPLGDDEIRFVPHHLAHAAGAYSWSGFDEAAILVADAQGEVASTSTYLGVNDRVEERWTEPISNSLGYFYAAVTEFLGWELNDGEGKTMGLAPYGRPEAAPAVERLLSVSADTWRVHPRLGEVVFERPAEVERALGIPRRSAQDPLRSPYADVAAAAQRLLEQAWVVAARRALAESPGRNLCVTGGVALNCKANMALRREVGPTGLYFQAPAGDGGATVGAALAVASELGELERERVEHDYWGPSYTDEEIESVLAERRVRYTRSSDVAREVASRLAAGEIVGWFQGRMELGPRSLGGRAILADPREEATRDRVNRLKSREAWRPLCPSILAEKAGEYLEDATDAPFMILSFEVKPERRKEIAAAVHVDGSTRPQTVRKETNPRFHRAIEAFERASGVPVLLNTSFNSAGFPIVATPLQALADFYAMGLDALAIGPFLVDR